MAIIAYLNSTTPIPNIASVEPSREPLGDKARTAGGTMRHDALTTAKNGWRLKCMYLTSTQCDAITDELDAVYDGAIAFWISSLGGTASTSSINAYVDVDGDEWVQFQSSSGWVSEGHNVSLTVIEQ